MPKMRLMSNIMPKMKCWGKSEKHFALFVWQTRGGARCKLLILDIYNQNFINEKSFQCVYTWYMDVVNCGNSICQLCHGFDNTVLQQYAALLCSFALYNNITHNHLVLGKCRVDLRVFCENVALTWEYCFLFQSVIQIGIHLSGLEQMTPVHVMNYSKCPRICQFLWN